MLKKIFMTAVFSAASFVLCGAEMYEAAYQAGLAAEKRGDYAVAVDAYNEAVELVGTNTRIKAGILCRTAECYRKSKQWDKAIALYRQVLEIKDAAAEEKGLSQLNIGAGLMMQGKYPEAIAAFEKVLAMKKLTWQKGQAQINIGSCLRLQKKYPEAVAAYEKVLTLENPLPGHVVESHRLSGLCLLLQKKYPQAKAACEKALACREIREWQKKDCRRMLEQIKAASGF